MMGEFTHHAYVAEGDVGKSFMQLKEVSEKLGIEIVHNPDVWIQHIETFTIDNARDLKETQLRKALSGGSKYFFLSFLFITHEAQNSLLKVLEEPTKNTHIFLITPSRHSLLPTLLSRLAVWEMEDKEPVSDTKEAEVFCAGTITARLAIVTPMVEKKNKTQALELVTNIELFLKDDVLKNKERLEYVLSLKQDLFHRIVPLKTILEALVYLI